MASWFDSSTGITVPNKLCNSLAHFWLLVIMRNKSMGGSTARMACSGVLMTGFQDFEADLEVIQDV